LLTVIIKLEVCHYTVGSIAFFNVTCLWRVMFLLACPEFCGIYYCQNGWET